MRIDMEQFLAVAMALGTAGAIGVAVYSQRGDDEPVAADSDTQDEDVEQEIAASPPPPAPAPPAVVPTEPAAPPPLPEEPDEDFLKDPAIDGMPAPHVEGFG